MSLGMQKKRVVLRTGVGAIFTRRIAKTWRIDCLLLYVNAIHYISMPVPYSVSQNALPVPNAALIYVPSCTAEQRKWNQSETVAPMPDPTYQTVSLHCPSLTCTVPFASNFRVPPRAFLNAS